MAASLTIEKISDVHYILNSSSRKSSSSCSLADVDGSVINISDPTTTTDYFATLAIKSVSRSLLLCDRVGGAAHITNVQDSTIVIWSRQVRLHNCRNCVIYLWTSSRPVIEDCYSIKFSPLPDLLVDSRSRIKAIRQS